MAQEAEPKAAPTKGVAFGIFAHSYGFGFDIQGRFLRENSDLTVGVSLGSLKHPKELTIESAYMDQGGKDYIFDKKNYAYVLAPSIGFSKPLIRKTGYNKISLSMNVAGGPILALLKPYFVEVAIPFSGNQATVEVDRYDADKYNYTNIVGEADFFLGMNEIQVVPGLRGKLGTMVDFSSSREYIRGVELSVYADYYTKAPALMDLTANRNLYVGGAVEILIGNNW